MPPKPASKAYRDQQRERLVKLGVEGHQLIEQVVVDLIGCGCRPREAWRLAYDLTQDDVAARFNQARSDPDVRMRGSRICEYEKWPRGGVRPSVRALKTLAIIYGTTWDRLVDVDDLEGMPAPDREAYLDISDLRHNNSLDLSIPRQRHARLSVLPHSSDDWQLDRSVAAEPIAVRGQLPLQSPGSSPERSGGGLPGEVTHFTGRDGPMAQLRARLDEYGAQATVVSIYAIDGMAGIGKTAFARHAARELSPRYPDGAIWVDLYGHTPGMTPREPSGVLEQMLLQLGVLPEAIKADLAERQAQWRDHSQARRMLIVLDNAFTSDQVLPLLPEAPGCLVLITSRRKLTGLTDAYPLSLDVLGWDEAERLFITLVGEQRCDDRDAVRQILAACGRLPLAIRLVAGRLRHHRAAGSPPPTSRGQQPHTRSHTRRAMTDVMRLTATIIRSSSMDILSPRLSPKTSRPRARDAAAAASRSAGPTSDGLRHSSPCICKAGVEGSSPFVSTASDQRKLWFSSSCRRGTIRGASVVLCRHDRGHRPPSSSTWWRRDPSQRCSAGACLCWHGPSQWPSPLPQGSSPGRAWRGFRAGVGWSRTRQRLQFRL